MDPVTHGVIGLAISAFSGTPVSLSNPISIGCAIGAMSPDIDIIAKFWGDFVYLKHHRGITHSLPTLAGLAAAITGMLSFGFSDFNFLQVFIWTFIGCASHTFFDILNSYGAKLFMPFTKRKLTVGILMLYDPVISILALLLIFTKYKSMVFFLGITIVFVLYLLARIRGKRKAKHYLTQYYSNGYKILKVDVLPSLMAFHKWDFIIDTNSHYIVGQINYLNQSIRERKKYKKPDQEIVDLFEETNIGRYFREFTPNYHIIHFEEMGKNILKSIDLRYYLRNNFMHHATVVCDDEMNVVESFFHPYKIDRYIRVAEADS